MDVLIVGGGPVGMVLACELRRQGVGVRVVDAARGHSAHSRATIVWPRLLELLHRTGLAEPLVAAGHPVDGVTYWSRGRALGTAWMTGLGDTPFPFAVGIAQSETERLFEARLTELGGMVERGVRLLQIGDPAAPAAVLEHPDGRTETVRPDWLVGADGAHSTVRELAGAAFDGEQFDVSFAITDAVVTGDAPTNVISYCYAPQGSLALAPLGADVCRIAVSVPNDEPEPRSREFFQAVVDERAPGRNVVGDLRFSTVFRVHARIASAFRTGRCLLAGDAAHIMSPAGAQGMNTGLQDAVSLGWRLGAVARGDAPDTLLAGYDAERRGAAHAVARTTALQTRWGLLRRDRQIAVRDTVLRAASSAGLLQRGIAPLVAQTGVRYPSDGPSLRAALPGPRRARPGERLPVLPVAAAGTTGAPETRIAGRSWTTTAADAFSVLLWPGRRAPDGWADTTERVRAVAPHVVPGRWARGPLADALGDDALLAVVRPDGHLHATLAPERAAALPDVLAAAAR